MDFVGDEDSTRYALELAFREHERDARAGGVPPLGSLPSSHVARVFLGELAARGWELKKRPKEGAPTLDPLNTYGVEVRWGRVVLERPIAYPLSAIDAVRLAAWLIVGARRCLRPDYVEHARSLGMPPVDPLADAAELVGVIERK